MSDHQKIILLSVLLTVVTFALIGLVIAMAVAHSNFSIRISESKSLIQ